MMKRIEIRFQVIDENNRVLETKTAYALDKLDINSHMAEPVLAYAASRDAKKFWESLVMMGWLEKT